MAKAIRMKDESGQLLPVTNGVLVQYNSSYSVSSYISNLVEEIANTEAATAAALTTLNHKDNVIMGYIDDMRATYVTYSYLNSFLDTEILPAIPTVDNRILSSSENPVQNKVIYEALEDVRVTVDRALDASSYNPVRNSVITQTIINNENTTSQALHGLDTRVTYLETAYTYFSDIDDELSETSYKAVTNAAITQEFNTLSDVTATALTDHNNRITDLEEKNTLCYYDASWLCSYENNDSVSLDLTNELLRYKNTTTVLINGKQCEVVNFSTTEVVNGQLAMRIQVVEVSYIKEISHATTEDYNGYGVGDGGITINTTKLQRPRSNPLIEDTTTPYTKKYSYDTVIEPWSIIETTLANGLSYYDASWMDGTDGSQSLSGSFLTSANDAYTAFTNNEYFYINGNICDVSYSGNVLNMSYTYYSGKQPKIRHFDITFTDRITTLERSSMGIAMFSTRQSVSSLVVGDPTEYSGTISYCNGNYYFVNSDYSIGNGRHKKILTKSDIDSELSATSYNAVTNSAVTIEIDTLSDVTATALTNHNNRLTELEVAYAYFSDIDDELSETSYKALTNARITQEFDTLSDVTATALTDHENRLNVIERRFNVVDNTATEMNNRLTALENYKNNTLPTILDGFHTTDADLTTRINALEQSLALVNTLLNTIVYGAQEV